MEVLVLPLRSILSQESSKASGEGTLSAEILREGRSKPVIPSFS